MIKMRNKKAFEHHLWYWHKGIPFVVAEVKNPEFDKLLSIKERIPLLLEMYNKDGNWFVLEHPLYWFLGIGLGRYNNWCFYDSLHMEHTKMTDDQRWQSLIDKAEWDIDNFYKKIFNPFAWDISAYAGRFIRSCRHRFGNKKEKEKTP